MNVGRKSNLFPFETYTKLQLPLLEPTLLHELGIFNENESIKRKYLDLSEGIDEVSLAKDNTLLGKDVFLGVSNSSGLINYKAEGKDEHRDESYFFESSTDRKRIKSQSPDLESSSYDQSAFSDSSVLGYYSNWEGTNFVAKEAKTPFFTECPPFIYDEFLHEDGSPDVPSVQRISSQQVYLSLCALIQGFETSLFLWNDENLTFLVPNCVSMSGTSQLSFTSFAAKFVSIGNLIRKSLKKINTPVSIAQFYLFNFCSNGITQYRNKLQAWLFENHSPMCGILSLMSFIQNFHPLFHILEYVLHIPPSRQDAVSIMNALYDYTNMCQNTKDYPVALQCLVYCSDPFFLKLNTTLDFTVSNKHIQNYIKSFPNFFPSDLALLLSEFLKSFTMIQEYPAFYEALRPKLATPLKAGFSFGENFLHLQPKASLNLSVNEFSTEKLYLGEEDDFEVMLQKMNMTPNVDDELPALHFREGTDRTLPLNLIMQLCVYNPIQDYILVLMRTVYHSLFTTCFAAQVFSLLQNVCCFQSSSFVDELMSYIRDDFLRLDDSSSFEHALLSFASSSNQFTIHEIERLGLDVFASSHIQVFLHYNKGETRPNTFGALSLNCRISGPLQMLFPEKVLYLYSEIFSRLSYFFEQKASIEYEFQQSQQLWDKKARIQKWFFYQNIKNVAYDLVHVIIPEAMSSFTKYFLSLSNFSSDTPISYFPSEINEKHTKILTNIMKDIEAKIDSFDNAKETSVK
ncbi:gamma tubulin complex subunit Alp16 [Schizosaccharomyces cryophilus OY26]|uniref:Gamma tubulin complex subunit Alp16 n=1 Tax=Schizosaccharomyces cryophilus (strain OY26 / ATCC MYA-4695 / CBS 11777 / NBRC 106824 / NRRL Y48691) TaxID=653667 RepID=S9VPW4_SCHCR|nr:gamma tubulin complex subunit Alp16 [Schizosaccharomyces cryophilus OY26]EPY49993.1 gamma tubulin complex subunit Alp16 [Schizosaccharomyces cryophilus OY26]